MAEKKKEKPQKMSLGEFVGANSGTSWADESEDPQDQRHFGGHSESRGGQESFGGRRDDRGYDNRDRGYGGRDSGRGGYGDRDRGGYGGDRGGDRDRGERVNRQPLPVPENPPFIAFVGNLPFNASEEEIGSYFAEHCTVKSVRVIRDPADQRSKGFAYVEFGDKQSLEDALTASGTDFLGRSLKVDVAAEPRSNNRSGGFGGDRAGGFGDRRPRDDLPASPADEGPWRRGDKLPPAPDRPERSGDRPERSDRGDRGGFGGDRGGDRPSYGDRDRNRTGSGADEHKERPKLNLQKRTAPVAEVARVPAPADYTKAKSNPFGSAKPRDENEILKKKQEQEKHEREKKDGKRDDRAESGPAQVANKFAALSTSDE